VPRFYKYETQNGTGFLGLVPFFCACLFSDLTAGRPTARLRLPKSKNEKVSAMYMEEAAQKGKYPFDLAVSDYFKGRKLVG